LTIVSFIDIFLSSSIKEIIMPIKCPKCQTDNPNTQRFCGNCATPLSPSEEISSTKTLETLTEELTIGTTFAGRYQIIEELGKGGMGRVYRVKDEKLDEEMALKVLKPEIAAYKGTIERFKNELKLARKIAHKSICKMYDLNEEEKTPYITMEYVKGEDLKSFIRRKGKLSEEETIAIAKQVCEGLAEAHALGVIHRDLKPQNIMIGEKNNAKVMDFGIARSVEAPGITHTGMMIGTPDYISPEQAEGEEADQRSDIYALGVILYEMVTGSVPFKGDTAFSVALKHKAKLPSDPRKLNPELSENLSRLILICMEKDRQRRYQTAKDLLADLTNIDEGFPLGTKIRPRRQTFVSTLIRKKLFIPALIITLTIIALVIWQLLLQKATIPTEPSEPSIAVLPFEDLSPLKDNEYFCDGLADELINRLTKIERLFVPARTSTFSFKDKGLDIQEIGTRLKVETVLEGSVKKSENKLRIIVQLVNVADGDTLWSDRYEQDEKDIFTIQDEISLAIVDKLKPKLLGGEREKLVKHHTENLEAYNLYLKGLYFWNKRTPEGMRKGKEYFQQAIETDPTYSLAYVGLADAFSLLGYYEILPPKDVYPKAKALARKALEIDHTLGEAYASLGFISTCYDWEWLAAEREFKRAIELNSNYAPAHQWYALNLVATGRFDEAINEVKRAQELDPLSLIVNTAVGFILTFARQYDEAIEQYRKILEMDPEYLMACIMLGGTYGYKEMWEEGIVEGQKSVSIAGDMPYALWFLGWTYASSGQKDEALKVLNRLNELSKEMYVSPESRAWIYLGLDDMDQAFEHLEKAYLERVPGLIYLNVFPTYDKIRSDPRFNALLMKMNLE
jgi:serine/threonine-protein kinase